MVSDNIHRLQDTFLEHLQRKKTPITIFLSNGVRLQGRIAGYDAYCLLLERDGFHQIVYKHAITTTVPDYALDLQEGSAEPEAAPAPRPTVVVERKGRTGRFHSDGSAPSRR